MKKRQRPSDKSSPYVLKDLDRHRSQSGSKPQRYRHLRNIGLVSAGIAVNRPPFRIIGVRQQLQIFFPNKNTVVIRSIFEVQQSPLRTRPKLKDRRKNGKSSRTLIRQSLTERCLSWCRNFGNIAADLPKAELSVGFRDFSTVQIAKKNCITA